MAKENYGKEEVNERLLSIAMELRDLYVEYYTTSIDKGDSDFELTNTKIKRTINVFTDFVKKHLFKDVYNSLYFKNKGYFSKNNALEDLEFKIESHFYYGILVLLNRILLDALDNLVFQDQLDAEDLPYIFNNLESHYFNQSSRDAEKVLKSLVEDILSRVDKMKKGNGVSQLSEVVKSDYLFRIVDFKIINEFRQIDNSPFVVTDEDLIEQNGEVSIPLSNDRMGLFKTLKKSDQVFLFLTTRGTREGKKVRGMLLKDIAEIIDTTVGTLKVRKHRILEKLIENKDQIFNTNDNGELINFRKNIRILPEDDAFLKRLIIEKKDEQAKEIFKKKFKGQEEWGYLLRWQWLYGPSDLLVADIYDMDSIEDVQDISHDCKSQLLEDLRSYLMLK